MYLRNGTDADNGVNMHLNGAGREEIMDIKKFIEKHKKKIRKRDEYKAMIEALEKQIPQKPREHYNWCDVPIDKRREESQWFCRECQRGLDESENHCPNCGQKLDWS